MVEGVKDNRFRWLAVWEICLLAESDDLLSLSEGLNRDLRNILKMRPVGEILYCD